MHFVEAKGILSANGGYNGMNIYRGCSHGCIYCDSRSTCYQFSHPFEDIEVKQNAPQLLEKALQSRRRQCMISTGSMSDPYMPCEKSLRLTRKCLQVIKKYGFGAAILTKSDLIMDDIDLLDEINRKARCVVQMTLTTYDDKLCSILEPHVCNTRRRIEVLEKMKERGIDTIVLNECVRIGVKGVINYGMGMTLREGDREYYYAALDKYFLGMKEKYIRTYGNAYELQSPRAKELMKLMKDICSANGIIYTPEECFRFMNDFPQKNVQLSFFD